MLINEVIIFQKRNDRGEIVWVSVMGVSVAGNTSPEALQGEMGKFGL